MFYIPPELTDLIIHNCVSYPSSDLDYPLNPTDRSTLLACSLVCKNWVPASRSRAFSRITLNCTLDDSRSLVELINSPSCSFRETVQEIAFVVPDQRTSERPNGIDIQSLGKILDLLPLKSAIIQGEAKRLSDPNQARSSPPPRPTLFREHLRVALTHAFSKASANHTLLTRLTLTSLFFESFSDLTFLLHSFPHITSLRLNNLSFALFNLSPHLPLQQLEKLHISGGQVIVLVFSWLMSVPVISASPIRELRLDGFSQSKEVYFLARYLAVARMVEYVQVGFREGWQVDGSQLLNETIQDDRNDLANIPRIVISATGDRPKLKKFP